MLLLRLRKGKSREGWSERWGHLPEALADKRSPRVWVHAASVGEVMAAAPILRAYRERRLDDEIVMTVITPGGHEVASGMKGTLLDHVFYAPFDVPAAVRRAVDRIKPDLYLGLETELWPNVLHHVRASGAKLVLVNGRLSDRSFPRYRRLRALFTHVLANFDRILTQAETDSERFCAIGALPRQVSTFGNAKFDENLPRLEHDEAESLLEDLGIPKDSLVLVVGSTRVVDEERIVLQAYRELTDTFPNLALIHAPRHPDRTGELEAVMRELGLKPHRRSATARHDEPTQHLILDTFGELARVYGVADVAFIGNSLVPPGGGQNLLQPLAQGVSVVYGPYMQNFRDLCALAENMGVGFRVDDLASLVQKVTELFQDGPERPCRVERAVALVEANRGASARYADAIVELMEQRLGVAGSPS